MQVGQPRGWTRTGLPVSVYYRTAKPTNNYRTRLRKINGSGSRSESWEDARKASSRLTRISKPPRRSLRSGFLNGRRTVRVARADLLYNWQG